MPNAGEVLFSGSRFIFWALSPFLLSFVILSLFLPGPWSVGSAAWVAGLDLMAVLLVLALYNPRRFQWAGRSATGLVFAAFLLYLVSEIASGDAWSLGSEASPLNALLGLLSIGVPSLRYAILGRFGKKPVGDSLEGRFLSGTCPNCRGDLNGHEWAMFARTVAGDSDKARLAEFFSRVHQRDWRSVAGFADGDVTQDNVEAYAVRCSSGGVVFLVRSPFERFESDQLCLRETISAAELLEIDRAIPPTSWQKQPAADRT